MHWIRQHFAIFNIIWFQCFWWLAVYFNNPAVIFCVILLAIHFILSPCKRNDLTICVLSIIGIILDAILYQSGLFIFSPSSSILPIWLILLWPAFMITFNHSLAWVIKLPIMVSTSIMAIGGALSYFFAHQLGAVQFLYSTTVTTLIILACWLPLMYLIISYLKKRWAI